MFLVGIFKYMRTLYRDFGSFYKVYAINARSIGVAEPEYVEVLLILYIILKYYTQYLKIMCTGFCKTTFCV